jgi:hypothetical protein
MAAMGYHACHNVAGGFEGLLDDERQRGTVGGWKAAGLPWLQGQEEGGRVIPPKVTSAPSLKLDCP